MTKPDGYIPKHCHHAPSNQGYVRLSGKLIYTGIWGSPEATGKYERLVAEWLIQGRRAPNPDAIKDGYSIEDLLADYWVHATSWYLTPDGKPSRELDNIRYALRPLRALYGPVPAESFGPLQLKAHREHLIRLGTLCRKTINQRVDIVRRVFKWAVAEQKVSAGLFNALSCVRNLPFGRGGARESEEVRPVPEADVTAVLPHLSSVVAAMVQLQWLTGMRPGEVAMLRMVDLDRTGKTWIYTPRTHKTRHLGRTRQIPMGPRAQDVLRPHLKLAPEAYVFSPKDADSEQRARKAANRRTPMTPSHKTRHQRAMRNPKRALNDFYSVPAYERAIARACVAAGVPHWSPNQLRHSAATRITSGYGIEAARASLGHSSAAVTEIYAEADLNKVIHIMEQIG